MSRHRATLVLIALAAALSACAGELKNPPVGDSQPAVADSAAGSQEAGTSGTPCPCKAPYKCVNKVCRLQCKSAKCNAQGGCPKGQACLKSTAGVAVCVPGVALGQPCSDSINCAGGTLCLSFSPSNPNGNCYAVCDPKTGGPCPSGKTCYLNTKSGCGYCYP